MPYGISRLLLYVEALLLGTLTLFSLSVGTLMTAGLFLQGLGGAVMALIVGMAMAFVVAAYYIICRFIFDGHRGLRSIPKFWWYIVCAGTVYCLSALVLGFFQTPADTDSVPMFLFLVTGSAGLLYLIPLAHILLELKFRQRGLDAA
jgi:hypothetical protein